MRLFLYAPVVLLGLCAAANAQEPPDPAPTTPVDTVELTAFEPTREEAKLEAYVDGVVAAHMREHGTPGVTVSVVQNGKLLFAKGYGVADAAGTRSVAGDATMFRIGSVSKTFIWTSVMMLYERGLIDLDEDVNAYLEGVRIPDAFGAPVTMNHLMAHRAGFEDTLGVFTIRDGDDISLTDALNEHMPKRIYPPGARTSYSNWGSALAAKIVEDVSGVSYEEFLTKEIFEPLAMSKTTLKGPSETPEALKPRLAEGVELKNGVYKTADYMQIGPFAPAGAMASTAEDMAHWMLLHLDGGANESARLLKAETHAEMLSRAFSDRTAGADLMHGFMAQPYRGVETYGHGGATSAFYTNMVLVPELQVGIFISQNAATDRTLVTDLPKLVIDYLRPDAMAPRSGMGIAHLKDATAYAGQYLANRRSFSKFEKLFSLSDSYSVSSTGNGALVVAHAGDAHLYEPVPGVADTFENRFGSRIVFGRNDAGKVAYLSDGSGVHSYDRPGPFDNGSFLNASLGAVVLFSLTTLAGAWRRQGRPHGHKSIGVWLNRGDVVISGLVLFFAGLLAAMSIALSSASASVMLDYPPLTITLMRSIGFALFAAAIVLVVSAPFAWMRSGWSIWRKAHHSAFVASLALFAVMLVAWRVIFSATA